MRHIRHVVRARQIRARLKCLSLSWAEIRQALERAAAELETVQQAWAEDAAFVASVAESIDPNRRRHFPETERLNELRNALHTVQWLLPRARL
jgi:hypothetical protein